MKTVNKYFNRRFVINFFSLASVQSINLLVPLLVTPHLIATLGIRNFGIIAFAQTLGAFSTNIVDFGFNYTSTREISIHRLNKTKISSIVFHTVVAKIIIFILWLFILLPSIFFLRKNDYLIIILFQIGVFAQIFIPNFLFQGIEKAKIVAWINIPIKLLNIILVYILIREDNDMVIFPMIQVISTFLGILLSVYYYIKYNFVKVPIKVSKLIINIKKSFPAFISSFSINMYANTNTLFLAFFVSDAELGYYSVAEKIYFIIKQPFNVFISIAYPIACKIARENLKSLLEFLNNCIRNVVFIYLIFLALVFIFTPQISYFFIKENNINQVSLIRLIVFLPIFILLLNFKPYLFYLSTEKEKINNEVIMVCTTGGIFLCIILSFFFHALGAISSLIITEISVGIWLVYKLKKVQI